jgi:phosphoglycolate phosphatase-like HAD superfamily hydrolase
VADRRLAAVVFDFDGVILESAEVKTEAFVALFAAHGEAIAAKVLAHHLANLGISRFVKFDWIYRNLLGRELGADERRELGERFSALALERVLACPFVPGAREALDALGAELPLFVASGTPQDELEQVVARRGLAACFREVWGSPAEKPAILRDLLRRHHLAPERLLFVGDGESDHQAALAVGVHFLARDTPALHPAWQRLGVRKVDDLRELPRLVASW